MKCSYIWANLVSVENIYPVLTFHKQTQIPRLKSASEVYRFRLSQNGKHNWRLAEVFAVVPQFFRRIFGGGKNSADPDIRRRLGARSKRGDLRQCLIDAWNGLSQSIVDGAIDEWQRLQACVDEKGSHFEHLLHVIYRLKCRLVAWINRMGIFLLCVILMCDFAC